jgi:hypothetical protein
MYPSATVTGNKIPIPTSLTPPPHLLYPGLCGSAVEHLANTQEEMSSIPVLLYLRAGG